MTETVAVLGATDNPNRFAYRAMLALTEHGHKVLPINPFHDEIDGTRCYQDLAACAGELDTITVYVRPSILRGLVKDIVAAQPRRVILNPGPKIRISPANCSEPGSECRMPAHSYSSVRISTLFPTDVCSGLQKPWRSASGLTGTRGDPAQSDANSSPGPDRATYRK